MQTINEILSAEGWLNVTKEPFLGEAGECYGEFEIPTEKEVLKIAMFMQKGFPLQPIHFICKNAIGYNHQMQDGSLCLVAPPASTLQDRFLLELERLKLWVEKYYIQESVDEHYEYLSFPIEKNYTLFFDEDQVQPEISREHGSFIYSRLKDNNIGNDADLLVATNLGNRKSRWSSSFGTTFLKERSAGLWLLLDQEPVIVGRFTMKHWDHLLPRLSSSQISAFYNAYRDFRLISGFEDGFILTLGYRIRSGGGSEIHWEAIFVPYEKFPLSLQGKKFSIKNENEKILWCRTINMSYERLFGRGKLSSSLTRQNILIIGTGALGSSLLAALVRGGCTRIALSDGDVIEPGNICRGEFTIGGTSTNKAIYLAYEAIKISPFIEIAVHNKIEPCTPDNSEYIETKGKLGKYDIIFDCSTDKYLSIMIDQMGLPGKVINLSITDKADNIALITGSGNIHLVKSHLFDRIAPKSREPFYVATGCWGPTFEASFVDVNVMLLQVLNELNSKIVASQEISSFFITRSKKSDGSMGYNIDYNV